MLCDSDNSGVQLEGWDQHQPTLDLLLSSMHLWLERPEGLDLLVQALPPGSPTRKLLYQQLLHELQDSDGGLALGGLAQRVLAEVQRLVYVDAEGQPRCALWCLEATT